MEVRLTAGPFDAWAEIALLQQHSTHASGACVAFVGTLRDFNDGEPVCGMFLEHYPGMTERVLTSLVQEAMAAWPLLDCAILHRVGEVSLGETLVVVVVWSAHRQEAFAACRHLIEALKHRAPFWKRETLADGRRRWVERNHDSDEAAAPGA